MNRFKKLFTFAALLERWEYWYHLKFKNAWYPAISWFLFVFAVSTLPISLLFYIDNLFEFGKNNGCDCQGNCSAIQPFSIKKLVSDGTILFLSLGLACNAYTDCIYSNRGTSHDIVKNKVFQFSFLAIVITTISTYASIHSPIYHPINENFLFICSLGLVLYSIIFAVTYKATLFWHEYREKNADL